MTQEGAETKEMVKQEQVTFAGLVNQGIDFNNYRSDLLYECLSTNVVYDSGI